MSKDYTMLNKWCDDYNGAAIYSLVDECGKRYIGQATHLQNRLETHRQELNKAWKTGGLKCLEGSKLANAAAAGMKFHVKVLKKIPWNEVTVNNLRYWEAYYLSFFGGFDETYNSGAMPNPVWEFEEFNDVTLLLEFDDADILAKLDSVDSKQTYIKALIRADIEKEQD